MKVFSMKVDESIELVKSKMKLMYKKASFMKKPPIIDKHAFSYKN